jgi:2-oxoacid:acceptor oxidoreductase delta subunit (pyruvate/2-ketoisovalerate family)
MIKPCENPAAGGTRRTGSLPKKRKGKDQPASSGLRVETALREAGRCLAARECQSCDICSLFCPELCITREEKTGRVQIDLDFCKGCGICTAVCPKGAIQMVLEKED